MKDNIHGNAMLPDGVENIWRCRGRDLAASADTIVSPPVIFVTGAAFHHFVACTSHAMQA